MAITPFSQDYKGVDGNRRSTALAFFGTLSFVFFILSGLVGGGIFLFKNFMESKVVDLNTQVENLKKGLELPFIADIASIQSKIEKASHLLINHVYLSNVFDLLETYTLEGIQYQSFSYAADQGTLSLSAKSRDYRVFAEQLAVFREAKEFLSVDFDSLSLLEQGGGLSFSLTLTIDTSILKSAP